VECLGGGAGRPERPWITEVGGVSTTFMRVEFTMQIWKEGDQFVAHAMPLDVMSAPPSPEAARQALDEAVRLFLLTAQDRGTLQEVLAEAGYELRGGVWVAPPPLILERHSTAVAV
jgi:hypothetical protein